MIRKTTKTRRDHRRRGIRGRGMSVLETALVLPFLLALVLGMVEFGWALFVSHTLQGAARVGARAGIVAGGTDADILQSVGNTMSASGFQTSDYTVTITKANGAATSATTADPGDEIMVRVKVDWDKAKPGFSLYSAALNQLSAQTVMRKEG